MPSISYGKQGVSSRIHRIGRQEDRFLRHFYAEKPQRNSLKHTSADVFIDASCGFACSLDLVHLASSHEQIQDFKVLSAHQFSIKIAHFEIDDYDRETELSKYSLQIDVLRDLPLYHYHIVTPVQRTARGGMGLFRWTLTSCATNTRHREYYDDLTFEHRYYASSNFEEIRNSTQSGHHLDKMLGSICLFRRDSQRASGAGTTTVKLEDRISLQRPSGRETGGGESSDAGRSLRRSSSPMRRSATPTPPKHGNEDRSIMSLRIRNPGRDPRGAYEDYNEVYTRDPSCKTPFRSSGMQQEGTEGRLAHRRSSVIDRSVAHKGLSSTNFDVDDDELDRALHTIVKARSVKRRQSSTSRQDKLGTVQGEVTRRASCSPASDEHILNDGTNTSEWDRLNAVLEERNKRIQMLQTQRLHYKIARRNDECEALELQVEAEKKLYEERQQGQKRATLRASSTIKSNSTETSNDL